ncbi:MAG: stalk domain-containing protein [Bacillota bacterium]|nr:stalk domain-containing protein [Bacillota bacterium]
MRKIIACIVCLVILGSCFAFVQKDNSINVFVDGKQLEFDVAPVIVEGRTLLPLRGIFETLNIEVSWDGETKTVTGISNDKEIVLKVDSKVALINGKEVTMDVPAKIIDNRTMVPVRFIAESTGLNVSWDENSRSVMISSNIKTDSVTNQNYKKYVSEKDIIRDTSKLGSVYKKYYSKYIQYMAPNGKPITIVAHDKVSDEQVLKAYNQLSFYLEDFGAYKKGPIANKMAENGAVLVMPNGADRESDIPEKALQGQPLYQMEVPTVGSKWYTKNDYEHRDAAYEEILHMVHDYGIGTKSNPGALPKLQDEIYKAMKNSMPTNKSDWGKKGLWGLDSKDWLLELEKEGSLEQEYLASVVDSYYGLWAAFTENDGGMWGIYTSKTREDIKKNDPMGYKIVSEFLPSHITYMARVESEFSGTFKMYYDEKEPYTHKSKYLKNARLLGSKNTELVGNSESNILMGNSGNNKINGKKGVDIVQFSGKSTDYYISKNGIKIIVTDNLNRDGVDTLKDIEVLRFIDKDVSFSEIQ